METPPPSVPAPSVPAPSAVPGVPASAPSPGAAASRRLPVAADGVLTAAEAEAVLRELEGGAARTAAVRAVRGVSYSRFLRAYRGGGEFAAAVDDAEAGVWALAEERLVEAVDRGEPWAVKEALKHRSAVDRWAVGSGGGGAGTGAGGPGPGVADVLALGAELERRRALLASGGGPVDAAGRESTAR